MSFKSVQGQIEKEGYSPKVAGKILAAKTREASPKAKAKNPKLKRVKMPKKKQADNGLGNQILIVGVFQLDIIHKSLAS